MAAQTLTAASNYDGPSLMLGLLNGEAITINGGALTIDSDVRWNQNAAVFGSITVSSTLGGSVLFDGSKVWELPFTAASGNVPTQNALGSNGVTGGTSGATGELLRVWGSGLEPLAAGGAMPATGWVKLRSKTGNFQAGEVVTLPGGATITISSAGKRSWLHIVGVENGVISIPRLGDVKWRGEWYELGTTNGADDQTFAFPVADACPAIWIEKYAGAYAAEGAAGLEPWLAAGDRWGTATPFVAQDVRGKYFGQDLATGVITIARRASNACGFKPAAGLKVFVPNLILSNSTSANWSANTRNTTIAARYETETVFGAVVDVQGVSSNWFFSLVTAVSVNLQRSAFLERMLINGAVKDTLLEDVAVGLLSGTQGQVALDVSNLYTGGTLRRVRASSAVQASSIALTGCFGLRGTSVQAETFGAAGSSQRTSSGVTAFNITRCRDLVMSDVAVIGSKLGLSSSIGCEITGFSYADCMIGTTGTLSAVPAFECVNGSQGCTVDGFGAFGGLPNVHPISRIMATNGASDIGLYNVGTPTSPYDFGTVNPGIGPAQLDSVSGVLLRRVYTKNCAVSGGSSTPVLVASSAQDVDLVNVWADGDDNSVTGGKNVSAKGCRWTAGINGQLSCYGRHWEDAFTSTTTGRILIACNEPTDSTAGQCITSFAPGSGFTSSGSVSMIAVGDYVEWVMPYFALGHTALANVAPTVSGTNVANHALQFQADTGSGWSAWADLTGPNLAAVGAINPATGIKLKVRATVTVASASNLLTYIRIDTVTDATSQQIQYPLPKIAALTLTNLQLGSDIVILQAGTETELINVDANPATTFVYDYDVPTTVDIGVFKAGFVPFYVRGYTLASTNATLPIAQVADRNYRNP